MFSNASDVVSSCGRRSAERRTYFFVGIKHQVLFKHEVQIEQSFNITNKQKRKSTTVDPTYV